MFKMLSPEGLASMSVRHPWRVVVAWIVALVAGGALASGLGNVLTTDFSNYVETESDTATALIEQKLDGARPSTEVVVIQSRDRTIDDPAFETLARNVISDLQGAGPAVSHVTSYFDGAGDSVLSQDRKSLIVPVALGSSLSGHVGRVGVHEVEKDAGAILDIVHKYDGQDGFMVVTGGDGSVSLAFTETSEKDLQKAELIGIPIALVILLIVFGALVAAGLPILLAILSIMVSLGITFIIGNIFDLSIFVTNIITTMGLAVGIDYTLLIIQRFREERLAGRSRDDAIIKAGGTASRAVLFSGLTVVVALAGLLLVPQSIFRGLSIGAIVVVCVAVTAALTLLPAVLRLLGDRVNKVSIGRRRTKAAEANGTTFWDRSSALVMRHPVISIVTSVGLLVAASLPYFSIQLGWAGISTLNAESDPRRAFEVLNSDFSAGVLSPVQIVIDGPNVVSGATKDAIDDLLGRIAADGSFGPATVRTNEAGTLALIETTLPGDPQTDTAKDAVNRLRESYLPPTVGRSGAQSYVTGATADGEDNSRVIADATIPVFVFVLGFSFIILMVVFRSIVVPLKAMVMNLLSVGAAYGLMVMVSQLGIGNELLGFRKVEIIETWVPLFMFAILFGLSMDYHVFLLTRIRERFDQTHDNRASVAYGVRTTAGMITGAALIMVAVFSGFAAGDMVAFQQFGFGLAVAVLIDATIVRTVLVPASMALLGDWNWYLPSWLHWIPRVEVEGSRHLPEFEPSLGLASQAEG